MEYIESTNEPVKPDESNIIKFHGSIDELKKYLPELQEQFDKDTSKVIMQTYGNLDNTKE